MKVFTLGNGFVANHLPYPKITARLTSNEQAMFDCLYQSAGGILINYGDSICYHMCVSVGNAAYDYSVANLSLINADGSGVIASISSTKNSDTWILKISAKM